MLKGGGRRVPMKIDQVKGDSEAIEGWMGVVQTMQNFSNVKFHLFFNVIGQRMMMVRRVTLH